MTIIAVCNQKGGVGKTTVAANLADLLARRGLRVLAIDADPQANLTAHVGLGEDVPAWTLNDVLIGHDGGTVDPGVIVEAVHKAGEGWHGIEVVAATAGLGVREQDQMLGREARLRTALAGTDRLLWDVVLIDCPPSVGQMTVNALTAADSVLLVTEPRARSIDGLAQMVTTCASVQRHYNDRLRLAGVMVNKHTERRTDAGEWLDQLRAHYGALVLEPYVSDREVVARATSACLPLSAYERDAAAQAVVAQLSAIADHLLEENRPGPRPPGTAAPPPTRERLPT